MVHLDSIDKIVTSYFAAVAAEPFDYKKRRYEPRHLRVSPGLFRGYTCPPGCGGCCQRFSLDYLPTEAHPYELKQRTVSFNGHEIPIFSDLQADSDDRYCGNLQPEDGRCGVHGKQPFTCDFELIRFAITSKDTVPNRVTTRLFGRGWALKRVTDGERGAMCGITEADEETKADAIRKLHRLEEWAQHFKLKTVVPEIIEWAGTYASWTEPGDFNLGCEPKTEKRGFFV